MSSYKGGGNFKISETGNRVGEHLGVVIMHEIISHGHPTAIGSGDASQLNLFYQDKLDYYTNPGLEHLGFHENIGAYKTNLYQKSGK